MNKTIVGASLGALAGVALVAYMRRKDESSYPPLPVVSYVDLSIIRRRLV